MSEAKKYDRSYMEQSVKPVLEIGLKRTGEGLKIAYGTLYGWAQAAKNGIYTDTTKTKKSQRTQKYPQYVMDMLWELKKGTGRTVRRNWRQVAELRPSVHQVGRKPYEQQYSLLLVQGVLRKEQHKVLRHSLVKALTRKPAHQCGR